MDNTRSFTTLNIDDILPNRFQPRIHFDDLKLNELAESIMKYGVIQPIIVRQIGDKFEIIAGERRYKASKIAGKSTIPAIVITLNDKESEEIALLENVQRQNLTPIEEAVSYKRILDMGYITQDGLAKKLGKTQSTIANKIRLLNLDDQVQYALLNGKISERHARSLLRIHDSNKQIEMLNRIINERLTVKKTDDEIKKLLSEDDSSEKEKQSSTAFTTEGPVEDLFSEPIVKKPRKAVAVASHEIIRVNPPKELEEKMNRKEVVSMDIDKIMNEARDINVPEENKDISNLMKQDNINVNTFEPTPIVSEPVQPLEMPEVQPQVTNDIPLVNEEQNKFINFAGIAPEEPQPMQVEPTPVSTVSFDSIFNQTPADLQPSTPAVQPVNTEVLEPQNNLESVPVFDATQIQSQPVIQEPVLPEPINEVPHPIMGNTVETPSTGISIAEAVQRAMNTEPPVKEESAPVISDTVSPFGVQSDSAPVIDTMQNQSTPINNQLYDELVTPNPVQETPVFEPIQAEPINTPAPSVPNIGNIPDADILEAPTNMPMSNPEPVVSVNNDNFAAAIKLLRNCASEMEKLGYYVDVDELDLGNTYQATFKINK